MDIRIIEWKSDEYRQSLSLRDRILRKPFGMNLFSENLDQEMNHIHIGVFLNDQIIGILILTPVNTYTVKMRQVAVSEEYQGQGIGTRLVSFAEKKALELGYRQIVLHSRKTAVSFYRKTGYEIIGDEFMEVSIPHYAMKKDL